ncbi:MAG: NfeD family protein [Nitriliruptoraceae bacterium]
MATRPPVIPARHRGLEGRLRQLLAVTLLLGGLALATTGQGYAQDTGSDGDPDGTTGAVIVAPIQGEIDLGVAPFLDRVLAEAEAERAAAVVLHIDTPGGRLDAVLEMRRSLLASPVRTIAFVDSTALSAGALVALASQEIHVAPGAVMGAATPVEGATGETASAKVISAVRSTFRATAQERGRDPLVAEAMVDPDVAIDGLVGPGELLTLDDRQMAEVGYADGSATEIGSLLTELGLEDRPREERSPSLAEGVVRFLTSAIVAPLLLTAGVWLLIGDLLSGGVGIGAAAGAGLLGAFFYGHLLVGLSGWEDLVLVGVGVMLLLVEVFVIPGFGVAGILGLLSVLSGGVLAMVNRDFEMVSAAELLATAGRVTLTFVLVSVVMIALIAVVAKRSGRSMGPSQRTPPHRGARPTRARWLSWFGSSDVLASDQAEDEARDEAAGDAVQQPTATDREAPQRGHAGQRPRGSLVGHTGVTLSDLRPAGVARIDGERVDVVTEGDWIAAGESIEVLSDEGYRRLVRRTER